MRLVLLGPPVAGKGTQAEILSEKLGVPHISTGDLFRANIGEKTPLGIEAKKYLDAGDLVPSELTVDMVRSRLAEPDAVNGFLLDGFPRSVGQAESLVEILADLGAKLDAVLSFVVDEDVVVERMTSSAIGSTSTATRPHPCLTTTRTRSSPSMRWARSTRSAPAR